MQFLPPFSPNFPNLKITTIKCREVERTILNTSPILENEKRSFSNRKKARRICIENYQYQALLYLNRGIYSTLHLRPLLNQISTKSRKLWQSKTKMQHCDSRRAVYKWLKWGKRNRLRIFWVPSWALAPIQLSILNRKNWQGSELLRNIKMWCWGRKKKAKYRKWEACSSDLPLRKNHRISQWCCQSRTSWKSTNQGQVITTKYATGPSSRNKKHSISNTCEVQFMPNLQISKLIYL